MVNSENVRAKWTEEKDRKLLQEFLKVLKEGEKADNGFKKEQWTSIVAGFGAAFPGLAKAQLQSRCLHII